jgi:hypothetical protein
MLSLCLLRFGALAVAVGLVVAVQAAVAAAAVVV